MEDLGNDSFHFQVENELNALFEQGDNGSEPSGEGLQEIMVVSNASEK